MIEQDGNFGPATRKAWEEEEFPEGFFDQLEVEPFRLSHVLMQIDGKTFLASEE